jgi:capsid protein
MIEQLQWQTVVPMFCERIWGWFIEPAWTAGLIPSADVPGEWAPPKFESVNPWQDAQTDLLETRAGFTSLSQQIAKRGYDPEEVLGEHARLMKVVDGLGLVLDSAPRRAARARARGVDRRGGLQLRCGLDHRRDGAPAPAVR